MPESKLVGARRRWDVGTLRREWSGQQRSNRSDDLANRRGTFDDIESPPAYFLARQSPEGSHHQDPFGRQHETHFIQRLARLGQFVQIDQQYARFHAWSTMDSRNRPSINGNYLVTFLDQLCAQQRTLRPLCAEHDDVWRLRLH